MFSRTIKKIRQNPFYTNKFATVISVALIKIVILNDTGGLRNTSILNKNSLFCFQEATPV